MFFNPWIMLGLVFVGSFHTCASCDGAVIPVLLLGAVVEGSWGGSAAPSSLRSSEGRRAVTLPQGNFISVIFFLG